MALDGEAIEIAIFAGQVNQAGEFIQAVTPIRLELPEISHPPKPDTSKTDHIPDPTKKVKRKYAHRAKADKRPISAKVSKTEQKVLDLAKSGLSPKEIADTLVIGLKSVYQNQYFLRKKGLLPQKEVPKPAKHAKGKAVTGKRWTPDDDDYLKRMHKDDLGDKFIASELETTTAEVRARLEHLGLETH
jgi:transposase